MIETGKVVEIDNIIKIQNGKLYEKKEGNKKYTVVSSQEDFINYLVYLGCELFDLEFINRSDCFVYDGLSNESLTFFKNCKNKYIEIEKDFLRKFFDENYLKDMLRENGELIDYYEFVHTDYIKSFSPILLFVKRIDRFLYDFLNSVVENEQLIYVDLDVLKYNQEGKELIKSFRNNSNILFKQINIQRKR